MAIPGYSKTAAQLTAIAPADRDDGHAYDVRDRGGARFWFSGASSATADGLKVLIPDDNPATGRWLMAQADSEANSSGGSSVDVLTAPPSSTPAQVGALAIVNEINTTTVFSANFALIGVTITQRSTWAAIGPASGDWKRVGDVPIVVKVAAGAPELANQDIVSPASAGVPISYLGQRCIVEQDDGTWEYSYHWVAKMSGLSQFGTPKYLWHYINLGTAGGPASGGS